jgi:hypothetical protein
LTPPLLLLLAMLLVLVCGWLLLLLWVLAEAAVDASVEAPGPRVQRGTLVGSSRAGVRLLLSLGLLLGPGLGLVVASLVPPAPPLLLVPPPLLLALLLRPACERMARSVCTSSHSFWAVRRVMRVPPTLLSSDMRPMPGSCSAA